MNRTRTAPITEVDEVELEPGRSGPVESGPEPAVARMGNSAYARVVESHPPSRGDLGTPLHPELRSWANQAFGSDLSAVRVHTGSTAQQANREAGTSAYTVGSHIVLGSDNFPLLVHELAHTVQQDRGRGLPPGQPPAAHEGLADRAVEGALAGRQSVDVGPGAPVGLAGGDESKEGDLSGRLMKQLQLRMVNQVMSSLGIRSTATDLVQYAVIGFVEELIAQLWTGNKGADFLNAILGMGPGDVAQLVEGYYAGLFLGLVSPVTDLFGLAVLAEKMLLVGPRILVSVLSDPAGLAADAQAVLTKVGAIGARVDEAWENAKQNPVATIVGILEAQGHLAEFAKQQARNLGKMGATAVVDSMTAPLAPKPAAEKPAAEKPAEESGWMGPLEWIESKFTRAKTSVLSTPWLEIGSKIGYAVGAVGVQIALLLFTSGVGNAVKVVAMGIEKVAMAVERIATGAGAVVRKVATLADTVGDLLTFVEATFGAAMSKVLKPLEKILGPVLQPFEEAIEALKKFLQNLFGAAKKQAAPAVEAAAGKAAATLTDDAVRVTPKPVPSKATEALEHPPTTATPEPTPDLPKTPDTPEQVKAPEPPEQVKAPETAEPVAAPESAKAPEPVGTAPKTDVAEPPTTTPEATLAEPEAVPPTTALQTPPAPAPAPAAAPPATQPPAPKPKTTKPKTTKPKTTSGKTTSGKTTGGKGTGGKGTGGKGGKGTGGKAKKAPKPTGDPVLDESLDRLENDYPPAIRTKIDPLIKRIRRTARKDPARAQRIADRTEDYLDEFIGDASVDEDALDLLSGRKGTPDPDEGGIFEERPKRGKTRIPESEGAWDSDIPGEGDWVSFDPEVNRVTESHPIAYVNGEPVLAPYAKGKTILSGMTGENAIDFPLAREGLMAQPQNKGRWRNVTHLKRWEKGRARDNFGGKLTERHTWHHEPDVETMSLVPTAMHSRVPHLGGASKARAGMKPTRFSDDD